MVSERLPCTNVCVCVLADLMMAHSHVPFNLSSSSSSSSSSFNDAIPVLFRPTRGVTFPPKQGENAEPVKRDMPEWATTYNLHLDMNPWNFISNDASSQSEAAAVASLRYEDTMEFIEENNMVGVMADNQLSMQVKDHQIFPKYKYMFVLRERETKCQTCWCVCMYVNVFCFKGIVNLVDNTSEDGGFQVVPGFSHHLVEWAKETEKNLRHMYHSDQTFLPLPKDEPMQSLAVHVTCRAGSLIIWDQRTAHGSRPNKRSRSLCSSSLLLLLLSWSLVLLDISTNCFLKVRFHFPNASLLQTNKQTKNVLFSNKIRMAQAIKMFPAIPLDTERAQSRANVLQQKLKEAKFTEELTELGEKLFGLRPWN